MATVYEIIQGINQAAANGAWDGRDPLARTRPTVSMRGASRGEGVRRDGRGRKRARGANRVRAEECARVRDGGVTTIPTEYRARSRRCSVITRTQSDRPRDDGPR